MKIFANPRTISWLCLAMGGALLSYWSTELMRATLFQMEAAHRLSVPGSQPLRKNIAKVSRRYPSPGTPLGTLEIDRIGLSTVVVEGVDDEELQLGPGHIPGTSLPGQDGNIAIAGHRDSFFRPLRAIRLNDTIHLHSNGKDAVYRVTSTKVVPPSDTRVLQPTSRPSLTLVTCYPFRYVGPAPMRFVVRAERITGS